MMNNKKIKNLVTKLYGKDLDALAEDMTKLVQTSLGKAADVKHEIQTALDVYFNADDGDISSDDDVVNDGDTSGGFNSEEELKNTIMSVYTELKDSLNSPCPHNDMIHDIVENTLEPAIKRLEEQK